VRNPCREFCRDVFEHRTPDATQGQQENGKCTAETAKSRDKKRPVVAGRFSAAHERHDDHQQQQCSSHAAPEHSDRQDREKEQQAPALIAQQRRDRHQDR
jgi:hypothetical protein